VLERGDGSGSETHEAEGEVHPILVDALGEPVVAAWTPPSGDQRWYVIPDATDWDNMLGWLVHRALPEYVPAALRRARSPHFVDPDLQTAAELAARQAVTELEARYAEEKLRLEADLRRAEAVAEPVRYGLLYGSGAELVAAVAEVLTAAGLTTSTWTRRSVTPSRPTCWFPPADSGVWSRSRPPAARPKSRSSGTCGGTSTRGLSCARASR
jgi:hypothetical protein